MAKITPRSQEPESITVKTKAVQKIDQAIGAWWKAGSKKEKADLLCGTASWLKQENQQRYRQNSLYARLYGNLPLAGWAGINLARMNTTNQLPIDRPTMSVITSCVDTLVARLTQSRPRPIFLTDNGNYHQRNLAKQMNGFIAGELYQTKAYELGPLVLRDAAVIGTGVIKILENQEKRVSFERRLNTEILVDPNDGFYGEPRQMYEIKLVDRSVLRDMFPGAGGKINDAEQAYVDNAGESVKTVADQIMVVEGWRLPSGPDAGDGEHAIACTAGLLFEEKYEKKTFPFVFLHYSPKMAGFWGQGLSEQLMGTQTEINKLLMTISTAINLVGVPRVFVEDGSKVVSAHLDNKVGSIVKYRGTKPIYEVAPCVPQELYAQLQRLVDYAYQQSGISALSASSQKPAGINSGAALREYDDLQSDRFAALSRRYDNMFIELAYQSIDLAKDICVRDKKYQTIYPTKNGAQEIDLPGAERLDNPFVIQCYDASNLPREPAGRLQKVVEMMQAGLVTPQEGRRLLDYPDIEQVEKLANAAEERILKCLDDIIETSKFTPPDPFMDLQLALTISTQYYNLYAQANISEEKAEKLRTWNMQVQDLLQAAVPPAPPVQQGVPQAAPLPPATSDMIPNIPGGQAA